MTRRVERHSSGDHDEEDGILTDEDRNRTADEDGGEGVVDVRNGDEGT